jgi:hypothetical protein
VEGFLQARSEVCGVGAIRSRFNFQQQLGHRCSAIELNAVLTDFRETTHNLFHEARVNVHSADNDHVIAPPKDATLEGEFVASTTAG